jgi:hypothetical protein
MRLYIEPVVEGRGRKSSYKKLIKAHIKAHKSRLREGRQRASKP